MTVPQASNTLHRRVPPPNNEFVSIVDRVLRNLTLTNHVQYRARMYAEHVLHAEWMSMNSAIVDTTTIEIAETSTRMSRHARRGIT